MNVSSNRKILIVSNMYPSKKYPHYGIFVKNTEEILQKNGFNVEKSVMYKQDKKIHKIMAYIFFYIKTLCMAIKNNYDVVYGHYASHTALPILFIKRILPKTDIIMNVHGNDIVPEDKKDEKYLKFSKKVLDISKIVIAPSIYFKNILVEKYNINPEIIKIYPSGGINTKIFKKIDKKEARQIIKLDVEKKYVGFVSRIENKKGWDTLLRAIKILEHKIDKNVRFVFIGDGSEKDKFDNMIQELNIKDKIIYESFKKQEDLPYVYNSFDAFCFPTYRKSESLGLVGLEAMSCGIIVIASNIGGPKEYISDNINGFTFEPNNEKQLAEKIYQVLNLNERKKQEISEQAEKKAQEYSKENTQKKIIEIFNIV